MTVKPIASVALIGVCLIGMAWSRVTTADARLRVVDGDSLVVVETGERLRLEDIDAPELHGQCPSEIERAYKAKAMVGWLLHQGYTVYRIGRVDLYGRTLVLVDIKGIGDLGMYLVHAGLAREYHGHVKREGWC